MSDDFTEQLSNLTSEEYKDGEKVEPKAEVGEEADEDVGNEADVEEVKEPADEDENDGDAEYEEGDEEGLEEEAEEEEKPAEDKKKSKNRVPADKRIAQLVATVHRLETRLAENERKAQVPKNADGSDMTASQYAKAALEVDEKAPKKPDPKDFKLGEFDIAYKDAYDDYRDDRKAYLAAREAEFKAHNDPASKEAAPGTQDDFGTQLSTFVVKPDNVKVKGFKEAVAAAEKNEWPVSETVARLIVDSEVGAEITAHLHQNPKLAKEIDALTPLRQAARFGLIEDKFLAEKAEKAEKKRARASSAPPPIGGAKGGGTSDAGYASENFEDVERRWKSGTGGRKK